MELPHELPPPGERAVRDGGRPGVCWCCLLRDAAARRKRRTGVQYTREICGVQTRNSAVLSRAASVVPPLTVTALQLKLCACHIHTDTFHPQSRDSAHLPSQRAYAHTVPRHSGKYIARPCLCERALPSPPSLPVTQVRRRASSRLSQQQQQASRARCPHQVSPHILATISLV